MFTEVTHDNADILEDLPDLGEEDDQGRFLLARGIDGTFDEFVPWLEDAVYEAQCLGLFDVDLPDFLKELGLTIDAVQCDPDMEDGGGISFFAWGAKDQEQRSAHALMDILERLEEEQEEEEEYWS